MLISNVGHLKLKCVTYKRQRLEQWPLRYSEQYPRKQPNIMTFRIECSSHAPMNFDYFLQHPFLSGVETLLLQFWPIVKKKTFGGKEFWILNGVYAINEISWILHIYAWSRSIKHHHLKICVVSDQDNWTGNDRIKTAGVDRFE